MELFGFDWDRGNRTKCQMHGVSIAEIESLFTRQVRVAPDPVHSTHEERFKAIGTTEAGRYVFVVFTLRRRGSDTLIRPVSARYMHRKEVAHYEKETAKPEE
ncbi:MULTISPECIES: BrnT family toxin [Rhodopseudomonas]|uniref:BrnT family toxin n=1 Tax=Rhodopseudomonas palustris TaxID=1076 RepID=A0A0D7EQA7_RHOPL|nr:MULTISPECIES: BrnT family toxin [Rhodopseudomonas]KIZ42978.1 hypothetical protein OO17_12050 [Rhodopseudomonas palustris]MDF3811795.1 BrnT family toxin [Rhodopseudomonas sp. BAL398]WOK20265.1 BrnT family toxin [Rhodopseudomonas sp. BAL398]